MKKTFVFLALAAVSLAACTREELNPEEHHPVVKTVLTVGTAQTKTTLGDAVDGQRQLYWANNDEINVNGCTSGKLTGLAANTTSASFSFDDELTAPYKALYPASIYKDANTVTLPHNAGNQVIPLGGVSESTTFSLSPLTSMLHLKIKQAASEPDSDPITLIEVSTTDTRLSGEFTLDEDYSTLTPVASPSGDDLKVQITGNWTLAADATSFFVPVPAGTYSFTVKVMDSKGHYMTKSTTSPKEFTAGQIKPLKEFAFTPDQSGGLEIDSPEALIAFATAYNRGDYKSVGQNLVVTVTEDLAFDATSSAAFNATGGIGKPGTGGLFNGTFDGGKHSINGLAATVPLFARVGTYGTVKNVVMGSTSSLTHSAAISDETNLGAVVGYSKGNITDCTNHAPVTCSSTNRSAGVITMGGVVGRQNTSGTISGCENTAAVSCSTAVGSDPVYIGGIAGSVERPGASDTALIENCTNKGTISESCSDAPTHIIHIGGVVGWLYSTGSSAKMTITGLVNRGNVTKAISAKKDGMAVLVGGIVGGIHGTAVSATSGLVSIGNSHVTNCAIQNGDYNNNVKNYEQASHTGGFVGMARGNNSDDISFGNNCYVSNVEVICRRGFAGGFASCAQGATLTECKVLASSVKGSLAQLRRGGGLVGYARGNVTLKDCVATLTKDSQYSLYGQADANNDVFLGGLVGNTSETNTIDGCKAYVSLMYVGTYNSESHGWIVGNAGGTTTIKDCGMGGTYGSTTPTKTLNNDSTSEDYFANYIYGSGSPSLQGTNYLWDASDAPAGNTVVTIVISDYAAAHEWTGTTNFYDTVSQNGVVLTASANPGSQNGNYNTQWRFYQARGGGLTVSVPEGKNLVSVTITSGPNNNDGILIAPDGTQIPSGTKCWLSGNSAMFTIGSSTGKTNGRLDITIIVIEYE